MQAALRVLVRAKRWVIISFDRQVNVCPHFSVKIVHIFSLFAGQRYNTTREMLLCVYGMLSWQLTVIPSRFQAFQSWWYEEPAFSCISLLLTEASVYISELAHTPSEFAVTSFIHLFIILHLYTNFHPSCNWRQHPMWFPGCHLKL